MNLYEQLFAKKYHFYFYVMQICKTFNIGKCILPQKHCISLSLRIDDLQLYRVCKLHFFLNSFAIIKKYNTEQCLLNLKFFQDIFSKIFDSVTNILICIVKNQQNCRTK